MANQSPADFLTPHAVRYEPGKRLGFTVLPILEFLKGKPWDEVALACVSAFHPSAIRVTRGECTLDAYEQRVTVYLDEDDKIESIEQEVTVSLPDGIIHGHALRIAMDHGIDFARRQFPPTEVV